MKLQAISVLLAVAAVFPAPAAVAVRRLNGYEYNCTIRDLLGVDYRQGADFPADNFSYGFDNNAATLTVTPALLAKYLDAAKRIAHMAIEPMPAKPELKRHSNASASPDITWERNFVWGGAYDVHIAIAGRNDPFALSIALDDSEPLSLAPSFDSKGGRYADTRLNIRAGTHRLRVFVVRDDDHPEEAGTPSLSKSDLRDSAGRAMPPYPERVDIRGPQGSVPPAPPPGYKLVFSCGHPLGQHTPACVRLNLETLARRAWRRPVTPDEIDRLMRLTAVALPAGDASEQQNLQQRMETGLEAILVSPAFLFRVETTGSSRGSNFELASRLSYFLWSSIPDEELFHAAEQGQLAEPSVLAAQARRMLADPRSNSLAENFAAQWLEFRNLDSIHRDPERFPQFTSDLRDAMRRETELFVEHILHEDRSILDFLNAKYTFVNELLAKLYDLPGVVGARFRQVDLEGTARVGVLTQASVLTVTSYSTRTSPVLRGKWMLENILDDAPPPPPVNVPALRDPATMPNLTLRRQLEQHRANPACAGCHSRMDTLGFGLENFDAIGRWRARDETLPIDSTGTLPDGSTFSTPAELAAILARHPNAFAQCLTQKLLTFALGRGLDSEDRAAAARISQSAAKTNYRFSDLIIGIVGSKVFQGTQEAHD